jgi:hypothetical protein
MPMFDQRFNRGWILCLALIFFWVMDKILFAQTDVYRKLHGAVIVRSILILAAGLWLLIRTVRQKSFNSQEISQRAQGLIDETI